MVGGKHTWRAADSAECLREASPAGLAHSRFTIEVVDAPDCRVTMAVFDGVMQTLAPTHSVSFTRNARRNGDGEALKVTRGGSFCFGAPMTFPETATSMLAVTSRFMSNVLWGEAPDGG